MAGQQAEREERWFFIKDERVIGVFPRPATLGLNPLCATSCFPQKQSPFSMVTPFTKVTGRLNGDMYLKTCFHFSDLHPGVWAQFNQEQHFKQHDVYLST